MYACSNANGWNAINSMSPVTKSILTNQEAIAIDQDFLGKQGYKILDEENVEIFMKSLANGDTSICLFNISNDNMNVNVQWVDNTIGNNFFITDVWLHKEVGTTAAPFIASIANMMCYCCICIKNNCIVIANKNHFLNHHKSNHHAILPPEIY